MMGNGFTVGGIDYPKEDYEFSQNKKCICQQTGVVDKPGNRSREPDEETCKWIQTPEHDGKTGRCQWNKYSKDYMNNKKVSDGDSAMGETTSCNEDWRYCKIEDQGRLCTKTIRVKNKSIPITSRCCDMEWKYPSPGTFEDARVRRCYRGPKENRTGVCNLPTYMLEDKNLTNFGLDCRPRGQLSEKQMKHEDNTRYSVWDTFAGLVDHTGSQYPGNNIGVEAGKTLNEWWGK